MILKNSAFFLMITVAASSLFAVNLFSTNSGFETAITPWKLSFNDTAKSNAKPLALDTVKAKFGKKYLKIEITKIDSAKTNWWIQLWEPPWTAKANVTYTFYCWARSGDSLSHPFDISATGDDDSASEYTYKGGAQLTATTEWQLFSYSYTWTKAAKTKHFRLFLGASKGIICFDSMALDTGLTTMVQKPFAVSNRNETFNYSVQLLPNCMRIVSGNSALISNKVAIYSVGGRLLSSQNVPAATSTFEIPKPSSGAWVVDVNSKTKVVQIP